jgi:tetratricopeptide (TPR) repeat protein
MSVKRAFREAFVDQQPAEDILDFAAAARAHVKAEEPTRAIRLYQRCIALDPGAVEHWYRLGEACLSASYNAAAYKYLAAGKRLDVALAWDFEFQLGRACHRLGRLKESERWYRESLAREDHHVTHLNLALVYQDMKDWKRAYRACKESLRVSPQYERAVKLIDELRVAWCDQSLG